MGSQPTYNGSVAESKLFKPLKVGNVTLNQRIAFCPLTRYRCDDEHVPQPFMEKYYADRGCVPGTLVIAEATAVSHEEEGQHNNPGFVSDAQVEAWRKIISKVHDNGSFWFHQIWAMGRASYPEHMAERGFKYRSSSATPMPGSKTTPTAMTEEEILRTIQDFVDTSKRVVEAGGDGVEIHSAHGYLLDQFLSDSVNKRTDKWGGSIENRARLTLETVKAVTAAIGAERIAMRFSPYATFQGAESSDVHAQYCYIFQELKKMNEKFAYISLVEATGDPATIYVPGSENDNRTLDFITDIWQNQSPIMVAGGYRPESAAKILEEHYADHDVFVGFGRPFAANPDLIYRARKGIEFTKYNRSGFYFKKSEIGYNDQPFSEEFLTENPKFEQNGDKVDKKTTMDCGACKKKVELTPGAPIEHRCY